MKTKNILRSGCKSTKKIVIALLFYFQWLKCKKNFKKNNLVEWELFCNFADEKTKNMKNEVGKILIDLAKLVFAGVVLAGLMRQDISPWLLLAVGGSVTAISMVMGLYLLWLDKKNQKINNK